MAPLAWPFLRFDADMSGGHLIIIEKTSVFFSEPTRQGDVKTEQSYERQIHTHKYSSGTGEREKQEVKKKIKKKQEGMLTDTNKLLIQMLLIQSCAAFRTYIAPIM